MQKLQQHIDLSLQLQLLSGHLEAKRKVKASLANKLHMRRDEVAQS